MHDVLIVGLPMLMILAGILMNRADVKELRAEMKNDIRSVRSELKDSKSSTSDQFTQMRAEAAERHSEVLARFNVLEADMRQFYHLTGKLEARKDALEKR